MPDAADVLVTLAEIARVAGVGRAAVSNWRRRHDTFPEPVGGSDVRPQFSLAEVEQWLQEQGKAGGLSPEERLWPQFEALGDRALSGLAIAGVAQELLSGGVAASLPSGVRLSEEAAGLAADAVRSAGRERGQDVFDFLLSRWLDVYVRQVIITPVPLATLMIDVADAFSPGSAEPMSVLDPACGVGGLLLAAAEHWGAAIGESPGLVLVGTDRDPALASLAASRLALARIGHHSRSGRLRQAGTATTLDVRVGDSLRDDPHGEFRAQVVVSHPPFNERDWGHEELATDPRWTYGLPPRTEPELAWIEHALARLRPGGVAVLLMPPAVASRRAGRRIRGSLLRAGVLRSVIALPAGIAVPYGVPLHLWVLQAPVPGSGTGRHCLLIDASASSSETRNPGQGIDWPRLQEHVLGAVRGHVSEGRVKASRASATPNLAIGCVVVPVMSLLDEQVDLTPARYVAGRSSQDDLRVHDLRARFQVLLEDLSSRARLLSEVDLSDEAGSPTTTTVGDLDRARALTIQAGREVAGDVMRLDSPAERAVPVLSVPDLLSGGKPSFWLAADEVSRAGGLLTLAEPGDVVVVGVERAYRAWVQVGGPVILGPQLYLLRLDRTLLDPWFLAGCLNAPANARQASSHTSSSSRIDIRKLQVLQLRPAEQRRYAEAFRQVAAAEEALLNVQLAGSDLLRALSNGLSGGRLRDH
jgi:SAM-dependent methyltransferase